MSRTPLPGGASPDRFDVIVVGSGFGGAISAARLSQAGLRTAVVERGRSWSAGSFPRDSSRDVDRGLPLLSRTLGEGFSGNGDYLAFLRGRALPTDVNRGPTITTTTRRVGSVLRFLSYFATSAFQGASSARRSSG